MKEKGDLKATHPLTRGQVLTHEIRRTNTDYFPTAGNIKNIIIEVEESNADDDEDFSFGHFSQCPSKNGEYDFSFSYHFD